MKLIETKTLGTAAASIEFTSIPQTFTDLVIMFSARASRTDDVQEGMTIRFNGNATGYFERSLFGTGSAALTFSNVSGTQFAFSLYSASASTTANTFSNGQFYVPNYTSANNKSVSIENVTENNATASSLNIHAGLWSNTAAVTSISFAATSGGGFLTGTTASLYGILKGSDGIVTTS
jgi:hypothetical protein